MSEKPTISEIRVKLTKKQVLDYVRAHDQVLRDGTGDLSALGSLNGWVNAQSGTSDKVADLTGMDLSGQDLTNADFSGAVLRNANLSRSHLRNVSFAGADAGNADFDGANLRQADFSRASLVGASMHGVFLDDTTIGADSHLIGLKTDHHTLSTLAGKQEVATYAPLRDQVNSIVTAEQVRAFEITERDDPGLEKELRQATRSGDAALAKAIDTTAEMLDRNWETAVSQRNKTVRGESRSFTGWRR